MTNSRGSKNSFLIQGVKVVVSWVGAGLVGQIAVWAIQNSAAPSPLRDTVLILIWPIGIIVGGAVAVAWLLRDRPTLPPSSRASLVTEDGPSSAATSLVPRAGTELLQPNVPRLSAIGDKHVEAIRPADLRSFFTDELTHSQSSRLLQPYIAKWIAVSGVVGDVRTSTSTGRSIVRVNDTDNHFEAVNLIFRESWQERAAGLRRAQPIVAIGKLESASRFDVNLEDCELMGD